MTRRLSIPLLLLAVLAQGCWLYAESDAGEIRLVNKLDEPITFEAVDRTGDVLRSRTLEPGWATGFGTGGDQCAGLTADVIARDADGTEIARLGGPPCSRDRWTITPDGAHLDRSYRDQPSPP